MVQSLLPHLDLPPLQEPRSPIISCLISAASSGDLPSVQDGLAEWKSMSNPDPPRGGHNESMFRWLDDVLAVAAHHDRLDIVSYLLQEGFRAHFTSIRWAIGGRSVGALELFLTKGGWDINSQLHIKPPGLAFVAAASDVELAEWFLAHNASPNTYALYRPHTALTWAVRDGSLEMVKYLMAHGGDPRKGSLLQMAARRRAPGRLAIIEFLVDSGASINALEFADCPRDFDTYSGRGLGTALHAAVKSEQKTSIVALLAKGARKDIKDTKGRTPMDLAKEWDLRGIVELLEDQQVPHLLE